MANISLVGITNLIDIPRPLVTKDIKYIEKSNFLNEKTPVVFKA